VSEIGELEVILNIFVGFSNLKGMSVRHSRITCEVLCRIAELVKSIAEFQFVDLPVKMNKGDGKYLLSFYNDISK